MAITYSLKVTQMDRVPQTEGQTDVVVRVHWAYVGKDGDNSAAFGGTTDVHYVAGSAFTVYASLTEEQVAAWVLNTWTEDERARYETAIADQLAVQAAPLPWPTGEAMPATPAP